MIRESRFVLSRRPYAVGLASLREAHVALGSPFSRVDAVWFRRRRSGGYGDLVTVACVGHLDDLQNPPPGDALEFLRRHDDGRYGGTCEGRWDGERYWGAQEPDIIERHLALLRPMLAAYPAVPDGYDGWWRFA